MTLRRRLAATFIALISCGCVLFAAASLVVVHVSLVHAIDEKLVTLAQGIADIVDDEHGKPYVSADDVRQINALREHSEHFAIRDRGGREIYGEPIPRGLSAARYRFATAPSIHRGYYDANVTTWRDTAFIGHVERIGIITDLAIGALLAAFAFFFAGLFARRILVPVERMAELAERIETSDLSRRLDAHGNDELSRLCGSFDRMLERLETSFDAQRRFVADASHELRTPLSVVRAETDLALRRTRTVSEYVSALQSIDGEAARLEELVDQLLDTMRREALVETRAFDVREVVLRVAERLRPATASLRVRDGAREAFVHGDASALARAVSVVLHNAIVHGGGAVDLRLTSREDAIVLAVSDEGAGFSEAALRHATERFWRDERGGAGRGSGLGLSIARLLVEAHGGNLRLENGERGGAVVTLELPRARTTAGAGV